jgi:hypothetical protein
MIEEIALAAVGLVREALLEDLFVLGSERGFLSLAPGLGLIVRRLAAGREAPLGSSTDPGGNQRVQAPFQSGYLAPSAAAEALSAIMAAIAAAVIALVELRKIMIVLPRHPVA